uniref:thioredoxin-dependent peroxiredoxin n=1 Tax=Ascaris lumbricoides TaxID=6252 RepID=A0A0M3IQ33_ASCLU
MLRCVVARSLSAASAVIRQQSRAALSTSRLLFGIRPLGPTCQVPDFQGTAVVDGDFKTVSAKDYKGKWLIVFFYPLDFTFVCPTEIIAFNDRSQEFKKLGAELIACSCDSQFSHLAWIQTPRKDGGLGEMQIPLLSDFNKKIADSFGVLDHDVGIPLLSDFNKKIADSFGVLDHDVGVSYRGLFLIDPKGVIRHTTVNDLPVGRSVDETLRIPLLSDFNKKIADSFGVLDHDVGVSYRGLFLIDPKGVIRHTTVNDLPVGRSVDEALRVLKAFQFVEKHGEVCPANWHDDEPTIKPDVKGAKEYFNKVNK